jgi:predicted Rossmann fold flavoprotein
LSSNQYDVVILGAGAAGLMCAQEAGNRGLRVAVLEHASEPGKKILISGGGRCNFTNLGTTSANFLSENPHFAKSALARYTPRDFLDLVEKHGVSWHEKKLGQLFCDRSARQILDLLLSECRAAGVRLFLNCRVESVTREATGFRATSNLEVFEAPRLVIATGGLSIPKMGATDFGLKLARQFGLRVVPPRPALVPLTFRKPDLEKFEGLAGVSVDASASLADIQFREKLLFTHRGISGPAVLQISSYWTQGFPIKIDLLPDQKFADLVKRRRDSGDQSSLKNILAAAIPARLATRLITKLDEGAGEPLRAESSPSEGSGASRPAGAQVRTSGGSTSASNGARSGGASVEPFRAKPSLKGAAASAGGRAGSVRFANSTVSERTWANRQPTMEEIAASVHCWECLPAGTEGFEKAEVMAGGVDTNELSSKTMECRRVPGLYFIGEVVDVTGHLGGYNFQWAWASAVAAASAMSAAK